MVGAIFIPPAFFHFSVTLIGLYRKYTRKIIFWYIISGIFLLLNFTPFFVKDVVPQLNFSYWPMAGIMYLPFLIVFIGLVIYSHILIYKSYKKSSGIKRNQIKYVFLGTTIGFLGGATNYPLWYGIKIPPYGNILVSVYVVLMAYSIIKYRLMDIRIAVTRTGIFLFIYSLVLGIPFWVGYHTKLWVIPTGLAVIFASFGPFFYNHFRRRVERVILKVQKRYQKALREFAITLIAIKDRSTLTKDVVGKVKSILNLEFCAIYLKNGGDFHLKDFHAKTPLQFPYSVSLVSDFVLSFGKSKTPLLGEYLPNFADIKLGLVLPLFINQQLNGFIILSQKKDGIYTEEDFDVFSILLGEITLALSEIYYFEEYQKTTEEKHKTELEKERLESAFQISEAYRHELGNIINIITLASASLKPYGNYEPTKEEITSAAESIYSNTQRADNIFNAIKKYNETSVEEFIKTDLYELVNEHVIKYQEAMAKKGISLKTNIDSNINVLANNNLSFAIKYLIEGAIQAIDYYNPKEKLMKISLKIDGDSAVLKISDTGKDVIADTIYKGVGIERGKEGGILYFIARRVIHDHKGKFQIVSFNEGRGTRFIITLPLIRRADG